MYVHVSAMDQANVKICSCDVWGHRLKCFFAKGMHCSFSDENVTLNCYEKIECGWITHFRKIQWFFFHRTIDVDPGSMIRNAGGMHCFYVKMGYSRGHCISFP